MKFIHFIISILFVITFISYCHQPIPPEIENLSPEIPINLFPPDDTTDVPVAVTFRWHSQDPNENDTLYYDFYLEADNPAPNLLLADLAVDSLHRESLEYNSTYYWKIVAKDQAGNSTSSPVWVFKTRHEFNAPPNIPANPEPENGANSIQIRNVVLQWKGGDPDSFSVVNYDVLFGETFDSLQTISMNLPDSSYPLTLLRYEKKYFWQIIAKDHYGSITDGPVWNFETLNPVKIFDGNFDADTENQNPSSLKWSFGETGADIFVSDEISWNNQGKSVCFVDSTYEGSCFLAASFASKKVGMLEFYIMMTADDDYLGIRLYSEISDSTHLGPQISIREGKLQYYDNGRTWQTVSPVEINSWYFIQLVFDCDKQYYNIFIKDRIAAENATWTGTFVSNINLLYFMTFQNRICKKAYIDDVKIFSDP